MFCSGSSFQGSWKSRGLAEAQALAALVLGPFDGPAGGPLPLALLPDVFTVCQSEEVEVALCEEEVGWREEDAAVVVACEVEL